MHIEPIEETTGLKIEPIKQPAPSWPEIFRDASLTAGPNILKGFGGLMQMGGETLKFTGPLSPKTLGVDIAGSLKPMGRYISGLGEEALEEIEPQFGEKSTKYYFYQAMSSVAQNAPLMFAAGATGSQWLPLAAMGAEVAGQQYPVFRAKGLTPGQASLAATGYGLAEVIGEKISLGFLLKPQMQFLKKMLFAPFVEVSEEELTELLQTGIDKKTIDPNMTWKDALQRFKETGIVAAIAGPTQAGIVQTGLRVAQIGGRPGGPPLELAISHKPETSKIVEKYEKKTHPKELKIEPIEIQEEEAKTEEFKIEAIEVEAKEEGTTKEPSISIEQLEKTPSLADYVIKRPELHEKELVDFAKETKKALEQKATPKLLDLEKEENGLIARSYEKELSPGEVNRLKAIRFESITEAKKGGVEFQDVTRSNLEDMRGKEPVPSPVAKWKEMAEESESTNPAPEKMGSFEIDYGRQVEKLAEERNEPIISVTFNNGKRIKLQQEEFREALKDKTFNKSIRNVQGIKESIAEQKPGLSPTEKEQFKLPEMKVGLEFPKKGKEVTPTLEGTPLMEAAAKAEAERVQPRLEFERPIHETLSEEMIGTIRELRTMVREGEAGKRAPTETGQWIGRGNTFPNFMKNKGWTKREVLLAIDKGLKNRELGTRQREIFESIKEEANGIIEDRVETNFRETRKKIIESDPEFFKDETFEGLTKSIDDEIMGAKEEWREQGYTDSEINTAIQEGYTTTAGQGRTPSIEEITAILIGETTPEVGEPSKGPFLKSITDILKFESGQIDFGPLFEKVKSLISELQNSRIMNHLNWMQGRNEPSIRILMDRQKHGPQIGESFRNMEGVLSQTEQGRTIYEAGRDFKGDTVRDFTQWRTRAEKIFQSLDTEEKLAVIEILDTQEEIEETENKVERAAFQMRKLLTDFREWMIQSGQNVGKIEGYFPHLFQGKFWVKVSTEGETDIPEEAKFARKVNSLDEALKIAKELREQIERDVTIMQDTFVPPDDVTMLSNRSYWRLVKALQTEIGEAYPMIEDLDTDDINSLLRGQGIAKPKPRKRFFGNMMPRLKNNPNFLRDIDKVMNLFLYGGVRKVHQDIFMRKVQKNLEAMPIEDDRLKKFIENVFLPGVLAHPTNFEEAVARVIEKLKVYPGASGQDIRQWMHNINLVQYVYDLGLSLSSATANASQFFINAYPIIGERSAIVGYSKAARTFFNHKLMAEIEAMNIVSGVSSVTGMPLLERGSLKQFARKITMREGLHEFAEASLVMFQGIELQNRFAAYWAGKDFALRSLNKNKSAYNLALKVSPETSSLVQLGKELDQRTADRTVQRNVSWWKKTRAMQEDFAKQFGFELNDKTNFRVGRENLPAILRNVPVRIFSPYKSFLLNQLQFTLDTLKPKGLITDPKKAIRFTGMSLALGGVAANPIIYGLFKLVNAAMKWLFDKDLEKELMRRSWIRGVSGKFGIDISGSVAIQLPTKPEDLLGRFGKLALEMGRFMSEKAKGEGTIFRERTVKRLTMPAQVQRAMDALKILETGQYITPIKQTPIALKEPPWQAAIKRFLGMIPEEVGKTFDREKMIEKKKAKYKSLSTDMTERFTTALKENKEQEINLLASKFARTINEAAESFAKAHAEKNQDAMTEALTDLLFWDSWLKQNQKFKEAIIRKTVPRQEEKIRHLPKYLRPEAATSP